MKGKSVFPRMNTLRRRMVLALGLCVAMCMLLLLLFFYTVIKMMKEDRVQVSMQLDLQQITEKLDSSYYSLLQISQQMMPEGNVGDIAAEYLRSEDSYENIRLSKQLSNSVSIMMFASKDVAMTSYFWNEAQAGSRDAWFSTFPARSAFVVEEQPELLRTEDLSFHTLHRSQNRFISRDVVSVSRPVKFPTGESFYIYAELYCNILEVLERSAESQNLLYSVLQLGEEGLVCYSSSAAFSPGDILPVQGADGELMTVSGTDGRSYVCMRKDGRFGYQTAMLVPVEKYRGEMQFWIGGLLLVVFLVLIAVTGSILLMTRLIYHPMRLLEQEINQVGKGDLTTREHHRLNILEFDILFDRMEVMKQEITRLMDDIRNQEKQKQELELSNLYYKINPHFLMNALNSVHWMAVTRGEKEIDSFIYYLNYILGYSMGRTDKKATFRTELRSLEAYLKLQQKRYEFQTFFQVEEGYYLDYSCARLILQPIAENAVCHNMEEFGTLWFSIYPEGTWVVIEIKDDGKGFVVSKSMSLTGAEGLPEEADTQEKGSPQESRKNRGIGLQYVRRCLADFYKGRARLQIESEPGRGTTVTLYLPIKKEGSSENV